MLKEAIDMCKKIKDKKLTFVLNPDDVWEKFDNSLKPIINCNWQEVKFLDDSCQVLHSSMSSLPSDSGGIYIFILKPEIVPNTHLYILYIGRAKNTPHQNLRKRCSQYIKDTRPKICIMRDSWGKNLFIRYLPLKDNDIIDRLEKELIKSIFPPCNDDYPDKVIKMAMKSAFM